MLKLAFDLFLLNQLPFERFRFSFWKIIVTIILIELLSIFALPSPYLNTVVLASTIVLPLTFIFNQIETWLTLLINYHFLKWWVKRGMRWNGQGNLFNLLFVIWFAVSLPYILGFIFIPLSSWVFLLLPFVLYSLWFASHALHNAIPKVSFWYSLSGTLFASISSFGITYFMTYFGNILLLSYVN